MFEVQKDSHRYNQFIDKLCIIDDMFILNLLWKHGNLG